MSQIYVTTTEALNWPTGVDLQDLIPAGTPPQQASELGYILQSASAWVEQYTYQPLYARLLTETTGDGRSDGEGRLQVRLRSFPAQQITAAQWQQSTLAGWTSISAGSVHITGALRSNYYADDTDYRVYRGWARPPFTVMTQYIAGYPNAILTASCVVGATTLDVDDATGMVGVLTVGALTLPGTELVIYDSATQAQETVTVESVSGSVLTLTAGTRYAHAASVRVSALPAAISTATIHIASALVKGRRSAGGTLMSGQVLPADDTDLKTAREYLLPFRRVV